MKQTDFSEMSAYKIQMPGNNPKESIQHSEPGESLKSRRHPAVLLRHVKVQVQVKVKVKVLFQYFLELRSALFRSMYV